MKPSRPSGAEIRPAFALAAVALAALVAAAAAWAAGRERVLFKDLAPADAAREVVRAVLDADFDAMRGAFPAAVWKELGFGGAWERARRYFPASTFYVKPGLYFMTHGFDADGRLFMEVHDSAYLALCVENRRTFSPGGTVEEYGRMRDAADGREAAAFREKLGRLERSFRDQASHRALRQALGRDLYARLVGNLRTEDYHMLAGGLVHEGLHAGLDDALVARLQADFGAGGRSVQWDEMRAFMAEIRYHAPFCAWAAGEIEGGWRRIGRRLGGFEGLRKSRNLPAGPARERFEKDRAAAWAEAALVRLRMREIWQSAGRVRDLAAAFRKDYVNGPAPAEVEALLARLERDAAGFAVAAGDAIRGTEAALRALEETLDIWGEWADGRRPFPPPVTDSRAILGETGKIRWPRPDPGPAAALMARADRELAKEKASL